MEKLFGGLKLARSDGSTGTVTEILAGKKHCLLFFGAKWAEPCECCCAARAKPPTHQPSLTLPPPTPLPCSPEVYHCAQ